ncbi:MAG: mevalonate kinase [Myxococcaceae bacterium]
MPTSRNAPPVHPERRPRNAAVVEGPAPRSAFGPGKAILLGEHAVVYGYPALSGALSRGVTARATPSSRCELVVPSALHGEHRRLLERAFERAAAATGEPPVRVEVDSDLPLSMGLGSSAALAVACARVLLAAAGRPGTPERVATVALEMEREFHGTPSGVDHTTSAQGQLIHYRRKGSRSIVRKVKSPRPLKVLVALVGERGPTKVTVAALRVRRERWPSRYRRMFEQIGTLAGEGTKAIGLGDLEALGDAMNVNHGLLSALQLSSPDLDLMVHRLRSLGALGAKLTGAGGDGGAVLGLFLEPEPAAARLSREGVRCFVSQIAGPREL